VTTTHVVLTVSGGVCAIAGGALIASPEVVPRLKRLRAKVMQLAFRRSRQTVAEPATDGPVAAHLSFLGGTDPGADVSQKVSWLIFREKQNQERLNQLELQVETAIPLRTKAERREVERTMAQLVHRSEERYARARLAGLLLVAAGVVLQAAANLVVLA